MKTMVCWLLCLLLLIPCVGFGEGTDASTPAAAGAEGETPLLSHPLPIDFSGGYAPLPEGYGDGVIYEDPTIRVSITYRETKEYIVGWEYFDMGYWVVDIQIGHASQLRTAAAESFSTGTALPVDVIADRVNAVVAFNGDYFTRHNEGYAVRQGQLLRNRLKGYRDVLIIDEAGDFHAYHLPKKGELTDTVNGKKVLNAFYFGPILVEDGKALRYFPKFTHLDPDKYYARIALCQVDTLHYKVILTTMEQDYILGIRLKELAVLCQREGAKVAYNLDGGYSTTLYFNGQRLNAQNRVNFRDIPDILYFASAWNGEE